MTALHPLFIQRIQRQFPEDADAFIDAIHRAPNVSVHVKGEALKELRLLPVVHYDNGFFLKSRPQFTTDPLFHLGRYYPQESSSMVIGSLVRQIGEQKKIGMALDLCAAPGGKTILLHENLDPNSVIYANEIHPKRNQVLQENVMKWGITNAVVLQSDVSQIKGDERWDLILLDAPCSATGTMRRHPDVLVLSDDIYAPLRYGEGAHATLAVVCPDLADRVLTVSGVSKSHAMTGFRIGVSAGPVWLIGAMAKLQSHASGNPCSISQAAAVAAFTGPQDFLLDWRERFRVRRDVAVAALNAVPGLATPVPDGAFYCLVDAAPLMARFGDDEALALHLLDHGVAVVAASAFGGQDGFRISFAADDARLAEALSRIAKALQ
jgi:23S rRNA U2552 (ribose-2'-O)-methylase RlmE/FtsJ